MALGSWADCQAQFVIPYELRLGSGDKAKHYSVVVVLAEHHASYYGEPDSLASVLATNYHGNPEKFLREYLKIPYHWYLDQIPKYPKIYGEHAREIAEGFKAFESMADHRSSAVVITEHRQLSRVLALLRVDTENANGRLASEAHFLNDGLEGKGFPRPSPEFTWSPISDFNPEEYARQFQRLGFPTKDRLHYWLEGENVELKNFGMDPRTFQRFFKYLYLIARQHKMFDWGASKFPQTITHWPNGVPIPKSACHRWGRRVSHVWLDAYSDILRRYYEGLGFKVWKKINNEATRHRDLFFMSAHVRDVEARVKEHLANISEDETAYLVRADDLTALFHRATCVGDLTDLGEAKLILPGKP